MKSTSRSRSPLQSAATGSRPAQDYAFSLPDRSPAWRWLKHPWPYPVPYSSQATTDLNALRGALVTEACRWEEDYWELFAGAGPEIQDDQRRVVPLGALLAADPSLARILELPVGEGIWRNKLSEWQVWKSAVLTVPSPDEAMKRRRSSQTAFAATTVSLLPKVRLSGSSIAGFAGYCLSHTLVKTAEVFRVLLTIVKVLPSSDTLYSSELTGWPLVWLSI
jgi:hypothetical protein